MNEDYRKYLDPEFISTVGGLELKARMVVEGYITGLHKSPFHGFSVEFSEHRQYRPGDDIRHIDWGAFARSGKYYIKQYEEETNLRCVFAVDSSRSMAYSAGGRISKYEYGIYLTAALSMMLFKQRDAVGLALYSDGLDTYMPPASKQSYLSELIRKMDSSEVTGKTGTSNALGELAERVKRRSLVVIISDLLDDGDEISDALKHFRYRDNEVIIFHLLDPTETNLDLGNVGKLVDMESGATIVTQPRQIQKAYSEKVQEYISKIKDDCYKNKIDYNLVTTDMSFDKAMRNFFSKRAIIR